jgi:hypothetical protein
MTVVKPRMSPWSSIRSTRRFAGARQVTPRTDLGEGRARVVGQLGQDPFVGVVETVHQGSPRLVQ